MPNEPNQSSFLSFLALSRDVWALAIALVLGAALASSHEATAGELTFIMVVLGIYIVFSGRLIGASIPKDAWTFGVALLAGVLVFLLVWFGHHFAKITDSTIYIAVIATIVIVYALLSGRLSEFTAPGGWGVKFAHARVEPTANDIKGDVRQMQNVAKQGLRALHNRLPTLNDGSPIIFWLIVSKIHENYNRWTMTEYIRQLSQFRNFKFVVLVDEKGSFMAYAPSWAVAKLLDSERDGDHFVSALNRGNVAELKSFPILIYTTITTRQSNIEALEEMDRRGLEAVVVIDAETQKPAGVVERDRLLTKIVLGMAKGR